MTKATLFSSSTGDIPADMAFKNNFNASAAPTATDDASKGYSDGSTWQYGNVLYDCIDPTTGAAVWVSAGSNVAQGAPVAKTVSATLTAADLLSGMITVAQGAGATSTQTLPTGTAMQIGLPATFAVNNAFEVCIINTGGASETVVLAAGTGFTIVGGTSIAVGTSATFRIRKTAANTFVAYRVAG